MSNWFEIAMEATARAAYYKDLPEAGKAAMGPPTDFMRWEDLPEDEWKTSYRFDAKVKLTL